MKRFYSNDLFIDTQTGMDLYNLVRDLPIYDYHCHMTAKDIYEDKVFDNIGSLWLAADHYKWRAMRQCGIDEKFITGNVSWQEKFCKYAEIIPLLAGNPLYHWTHLELRRVFGIEEPLSAKNALDIFHRCNDVIESRRLSPRKMLEMFHVRLLCTTDDPVDDLCYHSKLSLPTKVLPAFRPDMLCAGIEKDGFVDYLKTRLEALDFEQMLEKFKSRLDYFIDHGCAVADHGISFPPKVTGTYEQAKAAFEKKMAGEPITADEVERYADFMLRFAINLYAEKNIVMQMHMSPLRNVNSCAFEKLGPDSGIDTVGDTISAANLARILNEANSQGGLPKMIFYSLNDSQDAMIASVIGAFAEKVRGKMQLGAAWWFNDHKSGIEKQLITYSSLLPLGNFVGMLTDSRSYTSYCRFDYFRRILCDIVGKWVENGELDMDSAELTVRNVCYDNALEYFGVPLY